MIPVLLMNLLCFVLMGIDKRRAKKGRWRIPEKTLFITAILFGAWGGLLGMHLFRHKTRHWQFRILFPLIAVAQMILLIWLHYH